MLQQPQQWRPARMQNQAYICMAHCIGWDTRSKPVGGHSSRTRGAAAALVYVAAGTGSVGGWWGPHAAAS